MTFTPGQLQTEQKPWVAHNFGPGQPHQPLLGMIEECGELLDAINNWDVKEIKDALADCVIFCSDYCTKRGWDFGKLYPEGPAWECSPSRDIEKTLVASMRLLAEAAHHQLKSEQGIRGKTEEHEQKGASPVRHCLMGLKAIALHFGWNLMEITESVWAKVRQRDFKKNALTGGEAR